MGVSESQELPVIADSGEVPLLSGRVLIGVALLILGSLMFAATLSMRGPAAWGDSPVDADRHQAAEELWAEWGRLQAGGAFDLDRAMQLIQRATVHSDERRISFAENWLQWTMGYAYPPAARIQSTDALILGGVANCSERSQILKSLAESAKIPCRFVGLSGHVVLEMQLEPETWWTVDVDYGIVYPITVDQLAHPSSEACMRDELLSRGYAPAVIERYVSIFRTQDDNLVLPVGRSLSPRLEMLEQACRWGVWGLPLALLSLGGGLIATRITRRS